MSASNESKGFTVPKGPREKLTPEQAKKRLDENLKELENAHKRLKLLLDELEKVVA